MWDKLPAAARELIVGLMQLDHNLRFTGEQAMKHRWLAESSDEEDETGEIGRSQQQQESGEAAGSKSRTSSRRRDGDKPSRTSSGNGRRGSRSSSGTRRRSGGGDVRGIRTGSGAKLQSNRVRSSDVSVTVE